VTAVPVPETRERLAAIDVGSNSIRLLVAEHGPASGLTVIDEVKEMPRLAAGVARTGRLDPAAMERALEALSRMRDVCERRGVSRISAVATSAVREARNGAAFARRVREVTGFHLQVIDAELEQLLDWLGGISPERRAEVPGLNPQRADIILAGLAVTAELMERIDAREVRISAFGLREGLILEMVGDDTPTAADDPMRLAREFAERCHCDRRHVEQVRYLALALYDQLGALVSPSPEERLLLEAAAVLHDVGQVVSYRKYHKHTFDLIMHAERLHLAPRERLLVALISRYHRNRGPRKKHEAFASLSSEDRALVRRLSGILRIADGLDRGYTSAVEKVTLEVCPTRLTIRPAPRFAGADLALESWSATQLADVMAKVLEREIVVEPAAT
jgi:exopolyphosphatase/guanosine-5'-triphosphate,3'-diphosphate pyrophosphatase